MVIYKIINKINNKLYIGQTTRTLFARWKGHKESMLNDDKRHLYCSMRKYGISNFKIKKIVECNSIDILNLLEKIFISEYNTTNHKYGYNNMTGGNNNTHSEQTKQLMKDNHTKYWLNKRHSEETKQKMSESHKVENIPTEIRKKMKENNVKYWSGKKLSDEHKMNMSKSLKGRISPMRDKHHSDDTKCKISKSLKGFRHSEESKKKMSESRMGKKHPKVKCHHCNKVGGNRNMKRFHFDNCKFRK